MQNPRSRRLVVAAVAALVPFAGVQALEGPYAVVQGSYRFAERSDTLVAADRKIDYWAQVYRPAALSGKPFPLAIFLHGNHSTCGRYDKGLLVRVDDRADYTDTGTCPRGYAVTPNHLGYAYLAEELASWGYVVVSINANRGITASWGGLDDVGLNLARGRLILRHLALLSDWNRGAGTIPAPVTLGFNPFGAMDFGQVGLMGHSRGGEGARAALQLLRERDSPFAKLIGPVTIRSLFEIAPVDGQTSRVLDADGVNSMILLPSCDGDVLSLDGMRVFDRLFLPRKVDASKTFHGTAYVWGANHNAYNTEWQQSDAPSCVGGDALFQKNGRSKPQQLTAVQTLVPFFRATVGRAADVRLAHLFSPTNPIPDRLTDITPLDRGYLPRPLGADVQTLETFSQPTGRSDAGVPTRAQGVSVVHQAAAIEHENGIRVATVDWKSPTTGERSFQVNFKGSRTFVGAQALSFRTALRCFGDLCDYPASEKGEAAYGVLLLDANGQASNVVPTDRFVRLGRPIGIGLLNDPLFGLHAVLQTVQIPLTAFRGIDLARVTAVRFSFPQRRGSIDLADLMLVRSDPLSSAAGVAAVPGQRRGAAPVAMTEQATPSPSADGNTIRIERGTASINGAVDIVLSSKRSFPVTDAFPRLKVGDMVFRGGRIGVDGKTMTVSVPAAAFDRLKQGEAVSLAVVASSPVWQFGGLPR